MLTIEFAVPDFTGVFEAEISAAEVSEDIAKVEAAARHVGLAPETFMVASVAHAPSLLSDERQTVRDMAMTAISACVLRQPTRQPDHPGVIGDYVEVADLKITFHSIARGRISYELRASPTGDLAGSA
jgi:hypothetical protein